MNKNEFITRLVMKYQNITDDNMSIWEEDYSLMLEEPDINYDKLYHIVLTEWDNSYNAPSTKWIYENKKRCIPKKQAIYNDNEYNPLSEISKMIQSAGPPSEETIKKAEEIKKRVKNKKLLKD